MSYELQNFNKKSPDFETIVFKNGIFCQKKSSINIKDINNNTDKPIYIWYLGTLLDTNNIEIPVKIQNKKLALYVNVKIKKPAILNIFIQNAGKKSKIHSNIIIHNYSSFKLNIYAKNAAKQTDIIINTKIVAYKNSFSKLYGNSEIEKNCPNTNSNISFSALCSNSAKIEFLPSQDIHSVPDNAEHSSSIYTPQKSQIIYLSYAGLTYVKIKNLLKRAFLNKTDLF